MIPRRFPSLGLRDPTMFQGAGITPPDPADPNLYGWWSGDTYIAPNGANDHQIYTVGNRANYQVNKTDRTTLGCTNLVPRAGGYEPIQTRADTLENVIRTTDMTSGTWYKYSVTVASASLVTFNAQNSSIEIECYRGCFDPGVSYTVSAKIRNISGNTAIQFYHNTSYSNITINNVSTYYSATFTAPASADSGFRVGLRDPNAAGHGQIEVLEWQVRRSTMSSTYINTSGTNYNIGDRTGLGIQAFMFQYGQALFHFSPGANITTNPWTMYFNIRPKAWEYPDRLISMGSGTYDWFLSWEPNTAGRGRMYTTGAPGTEITAPAGTFANDTWHVISAICNNGGTSSWRKNLDAAWTGAMNSVANSGIPCWPGDWADSYTYFAQYYCTDLIIRKGADDAATQENLIRYLASRCGLSL